jgi:Tfp pilus assembly protein PilV
MRRVEYNQVGDTIVEVMLAVTIVGMVIAASYSIASRALNAGRYAQEQTEALKLAETQVEKLKFKASQFREGDTVAGTIYDSSVSGREFCIDDTASLNKVLKSDVSYAGQCASGLYTSLVSYDPTSGVDLYKVTVSWDGPDGQPAVVQVSYRLYQ